eukprot:TRINITY_DN61568_c0_g1_i1.p1 TRINITY_DN61568_c0_g1~~TRINITY_DN61568_c0_g1_i1.p1  ORF type:complete len:296 (+),score=35.00 TRINITY_DN61568_c0_g1_i1:201-1088(+)
MTRQLSTTGALSTWIQSANVPVLAQLMARRSIMLARNLPDDLHEIQADLDNQLHTIGTNFGKAAGMKRGHELRRLSGVLSSLPRLVFLLRRGQCLGESNMNPDELDAIRCLVLSSDCETGARILFPQLYRLTHPLAWTALPLEDLCLQPSWVLYLDQHTHILVWCGGETRDGAEFQQLRDHAKQAAEAVAINRWPQPRTLTFFEASSQARYLTSRLIPSHKDLPEEQREALPVLRELGEEAQQALRNKLWIDTDDLSLREYLLTVDLAYVNELHAGTQAAVGACLLYTSPSPRDS